MAAYRAFALWTLSLASAFDIVQFTDRLSVARQNVFYSTYVEEHELGCIDQVHYANLPICRGYGCAAPTASTGQGTAVRLVVPQRLTELTVVRTTI